MRISNLHYNGRAQAFEATIDVTCGEAIFRYPCEVFGPASLDPAIISAQLKSRALRLSDQARR